MQLDLGLKRASPDDGARNPPGPLKTYSVILAMRKVFLIIHGVSVPAQTVLNGSLMQFSDAAAADPSMTRVPRGVQPLSRQ
jgi:hypothetical protein